MQVSVENLTSIQRKLSISLPKDVIDTEVQQRLQKLAAKVKMPGFRPGKVPFDIVKQRYQAGVRDEVLSDKVRETYLAALEQEEINPVGMPKIDMTTTKPEDDFAYTAIVEIYPEVKIGDLKQVSVEKLEAEVGEEDIDLAIDRIRKRAAIWHEVVDKQQRKIQMGDKVSVDFSAKVNSETPKDEKEQDVKFEIGGGEMWPEFEAQLIGHSVGDEVAFTLTFPESHIDKSVVGKTADFQVKIKQLWEAELPVVDDEFAVKHGGVKEGGVAALRVNVRKGLEENLSNSLKKHFDDAITEKLLEMNPIEVPQALIEGEITRKQQQMVNELKMFMGKGAKLPQFPREYFADVAKKSVTVGIIFSELAKMNDIKVSPEQLRADIESKANGYGAGYGKPEDIINWFYADDSRLKNIEAGLLEKAIFDYLTQQITISVKKVSCQEALSLNKYQ